MADAQTPPSDPSDPSDLGQRRSLLAPDAPRWPRDLAKPILSLRDVHKSFGAKRVLHDVNLDIPTGQTTVIIGQSGSGKSVLLKMMNGLVRADRGEVDLFGQDLCHLPERQIYQLRKRTSMVLQNYALFDSMSVLDNITFPLRENTSLALREAEDSALELLEMLAIPHAAYLSPASLSGGMKKRVSFARAVITQPELVFFDEPTTGLDPVMIEFVDSLIQKMQARFQITSVIVSHDISSVFNLADRIAMLHDGTIIANGTPDEFKVSKNPHIHAFVSVGGSGRLGSQADTPDDASADSPDADAEPKHTATPAAALTPMIQIVNVRKRFGDHEVLKGVSFDIPKDKITVIIGGSGSGKSVIIKHIIGLFQPNSGQIIFDGIDMTRLSSREMSAVRSRVGMLFQGAALFDSMSVRDNIAFPLVERAHSFPHAEVKARVQEVLERLKLTAIADLMPHNISAGQRKRVGLARAIVTRPQVMIYDEPTTGQDPVMIRYVDNMIEEAHDEFKLTSIVISHDMQSTFRIADRIAMLYKGEIIAFGSPQDLMEVERKEVREFIFAGAPKAPASPASSASPSP
jgi:ABC-type transporter Mla maintaining outer membrane lipid asymmetry ATPase subunit MlaF